MSSAAAPDAAAPDVEDLSVQVRAGRLTWREFSGLVPPHALAPLTLDVVDRAFDAMRNVDALFDGIDATSVFIEAARSHFRSSRADASHELESKNLALSMAGAFAGAFATSGEPPMDYVAGVVKDHIEKVGSVDPYAADASMQVTLGALCERLGNSAAAQALLTRVRERSLYGYFSQWWIDDKGRVQTQVSTDPGLRRSAPELLAGQVLTGRLTRRIVASMAPDRPHITALTANALLQQLPQDFEARRRARQFLAQDHREKRDPLEKRTAAMRLAVFDAIDGEPLSAVRDIDEHCRPRSDWSHQADGYELGRAVNFFADTLTFVTRTAKDPRPAQALLAQIKSLAAYRGIYDEWHVGEDGTLFTGNSGDGFVIVDPTRPDPAERTPIDLDL
jgi:hypothetical protein